MNYYRFDQLFLLFSLGILLSLKPASASTSGFSGARVRCIESERQSLLKFKQGLVDEYAILSSWDNGEHEDNKECCKWWGVKCSNRTGHVIILDLHQDFSHWPVVLRGEVSLSLLVGLQHLRYLDLSFNYFYGFKHLIDLMGAGFTGVIPHQLGNLTSLQTLHLGGNDFTTNNLVWLSQLRLLRQLDLSFIYLNGTNWLQAIVDLPYLEELYLVGCGLGDATPSSLLLPNSSSKSLSILDLSFNSLTSSSKYHWFFNISSSLVSLDLSFNALEGPIPDAFGKLKSLVSIDLSFNVLEGPIPDAFGEMTSLEDIDIRLNHLTGGIPNSFQNLSHLRTLSLSRNNLSESFSELLQKLSRGAKNSLENLYLSENQFYGSLTDITRFSSLRALALSYNRLSGSLMQKFVLPPSLEFLDLSSNQITGDLLILIRPSLDGLSQPSNLPVSSSLSKLYLNNNRFTGSIPESIGQFSKLEILDLSSNLFQGTVSEVHFSRFSNLKSLSLSFNSITLNISHEWVPSFQLHSIQLANCSTGPHFPHWLITQNNISVFDLSFTGISDIVPNSFWDLPRKLGYLNLSHNQISGILPELSQKFDNYPIIDLSFNNFSGPILSIPHNLTALHLHRNMFVGSVSFLCVISGVNFISLDLSNNQFSGDLPNCWMNMTELVIFNLANNNFSSRIPESLSFLDQIQTLHLSNNSFVGEFPSSIKNCSYLAVIDVGGNKLTGNIPSWIGTSLTSLVFLSLRSNNFNGSIPQDMCHLSHIQVLDLSRNNITGKIPHCFNNFTCLVQKNCSSSGKAFSFPEQSHDIDIDVALVFGYYMDNMWVQWKRQELEYRETLGLLKAIDLSSNKLVGQIPKEIASLKALISLNLSGNHLTGSIISHIDQMEMLESLDLSRNHLSGEIPTGLAYLNYLDVLDLSDNNLSGRIPSSTQLQSFDASTYARNNGLCGPPLENCPWDVVDPRTTDYGKDDDIEYKDGFPTKEFYTGMGGFLVGFMGVVAVLFKDLWRNAYFRFLMCICDWFYVTSVVYWARLRRMLSG